MTKISLFVENLQDFVFLISKNIQYPLFCTFLCVSVFGEVFSSIGVREPQPAASEAFSVFGEAHREMERYAIKMLKTAKPVCYDKTAKGSPQKLIA